MVSFTNHKSSMVSGEIEFPIENPFSVMLLPWHNDAATLNNDAISGTIII